MPSPLVVTLVPQTETDVAKETLFSLYELLLRQFVEPIYNWDDKFQKDRFATEYSREDTKLVFSDSVIAGYIVLAKKAESLHLSLLLLKPEFQGIGIGNEVMHQIFKVASAERKRITLSCFKANNQAILFYQRLGFVVHSEEENFLLLAGEA